MGFSGGLLLRRCGGGSRLGLRIRHRGDLLRQDLLADGDLFHGGVGHLLLLQFLLASAAGQIELHHSLRPSPA